MKFLAIALVCLFSPLLASPDAQAQHHDTPKAQAADGSLAPLLTGLSDLHRPVTTSVPRAQQFFDQGLRLFYAFNFEESLRAFQEAARLDPSMAMAYWGQAMALSPNLNAPMSDEDGRAAYRAARKVAAKVPHHMAGRLSWTHEFPIIPLFAMVTFGQWSDILSEPKPEAGGTPYPEAIWHYARALARVARGETDRARVELAAIERLRVHDAFTTSLAATALPLNLDIAMEEVRSAIALAEGDFDAAIAAAAKGVALQDAMPYGEPALWHRPVRLQLGQALLDAGRPAEAEAIYREEIRRLPENGWGLFGLSQSLAAQGRADDARAARERFEKAWSRADIVLSTTTMMPSRRAS